MGPFGRKAATGAALAASLLLLAAIPGCGEDVTPARRRRPSTDRSSMPRNSRTRRRRCRSKRSPTLWHRRSSCRSRRPCKIRPPCRCRGRRTSPGSPGTCEAQAFAYGLGSYTAARAPDGSANWDAAQAGNEVSAAYQFALAINNGFATCPKGGQVTQLPVAAAGFGSPSTSDVALSTKLRLFQPDRSDQSSTPTLRGCASAASRRSRHQRVRLHRPNPGLSRQRAGGRVLGPGVPELQQSRVNNGVFYDTANEHHSQFRPRPVAGRLRRQHRYPRQEGRAARPEQLRLRLAVHRVGLSRGARQALVVVRDVLRLAAFRGGRLSVRSFTADRHDADIE